jgi:5-dehydro-2-deoxygluconokinase
MGLACEDFDEAWIGSSRALAVTGTHLSTPATRAAVLQAMRWARAQGTRVVLDVDYRPVLWGLASAGAGAARYVAAEAVTEALRECLPYCDLVVGTEEELRIAGGAEQVTDAIAAIRRLSDAVIVLKRGPAGCVLYDRAAGGRDTGLTVPGFPVEVVNVLGAGDAFLSGVLAGWLAGESLQRCGELGNACGALVVGRLACSPAMPSRVELDSYLERAATLRRPDLDWHVGHLHRATTIRRPRPSLCVLAFDHRRQLETLAGESGAGYERIADFKRLIAQSVDRVAARDATGRIGVIVDGRHGAPVLDHVTHRGYWVGRPVELPGSRPLRFEPCEGLGLAIHRWPARQVVKCLAFYHPDDPGELRRDQEDRLAELNADCAALDRELLIELVASTNGLPVDDATTARSLERLYNLGIAPAWWKLEPQSPAAWRAIGKVIAGRDPWCNGVLLLGLDAPEPELVRSFEAAAVAPVCRGFAVGRSIFGAAARGWFRGELDDAAAVDAIATNYQRLIDAWDAARGRAA